MHSCPQLQVRARERVGGREGERATGVCAWVHCTLIIEGVHAHAYKADAGEVEGKAPTAILEILLLARSVVAVGQDNTLEEQSQHKADAAARKRKVLRKDASPFLGQIVEGDSCLCTCAAVCKQGTHASIQARAPAYRNPSSCLRASN